MKQNAREFPLQLFRDAVDKADHRARMALLFPIDRGAFFTRADAEIVVLGDGDEGGARIFSQERSHVLHHRAVNALVRQAGLGRVVSRFGELSERVSEVAGEPLFSPGAAEEVAVMPAVDLLLDAPIDVEIGGPKHVPHGKDGGKMRLVPLRDLDRIQFRDILLVGGKKTAGGELFQKREHRVNDAPPSAAEIELSPAADDIITVFRQPERLAEVLAAGGFADDDFKFMRGHEVVALCQKYVDALFQVFSELLESVPLGIGRTAVCQDRVKGFSAADFHIFPLTALCKTPIAETTGVLLA